MGDSCFLTNIATEYVGKTPHGESCLFAFNNMDFNTIKIQIGESMAWINLDRPDVRNAMNPAMISELTEAFDWLDSRDDIRVVILNGNGKAFCAGADIGYMKETAGYDHDESIRDAERLSKLFQTIYFCNKAVIVDVHGACMGGANGIIAAADIVIAEKDTTFAFSEVTLGLVPATISPFVMQRCGMSVSKELMLTGRRFSAEEAHGFGLVNAVVDASEMVDTERHYIDLFLQASPDAIAECKDLLRLESGLNDRLSPLFRQTSEIIAGIRKSESGQEGMAAFLEKRKPKWRI